MFRKRAPQRRPHPDPRVEADLQMIVSMKAMLAQDEERLVLCQRKLRKAERGLRPSERGYSGNMERLRVARDLRAEVPALQENVLMLNGEIAKRIAVMSDDDLLWLDPR